MSERRACATPAVPARLGLAAHLALAARLAVTASVEGRFERRFVHPPRSVGPHSDPERRDTWLATLTATRKNNTPVGNGTALTELG
jgi:hypothetical protein